MKNRALSLLFVLVLVLSLTLGCATLGGVLGQPAATTADQISAQDALRTADREIKLAAVDIKSACDSGLLLPAKCELAKAAIVSAARAFNELLQNQAAGVPVTTAACLAVINAMKDRIAEVK
jgi:hypothetical protein